MKNKQKKLSISSSSYENSFACKSISCNHCINLIIVGIISCLSWQTVFFLGGGEFNIYIYILRTHTLYKITIKEITINRSPLPSLLPQIVLGILFYIYNRSLFGRSMTDKIDLILLETFYLVLFFSIPEVVIVDFVIGLVGVGRFLNYRHKAARTNHLFWKVNKIIKRKKRGS